MEKVTRRDAMKMLAALAAAVSGGCVQRSSASGEAPMNPSEPSRSVAPDPVLEAVPLPTSGPWPTRDPFLFCVHHNDAYPPGNGRLGPNASLDGRLMGQDFANRDGWNMYHGQAIPGFPRHPHRGFETVTVVNQGLIDHADSLGCAARYGDGDVQWLTAGDGINHAEMFPLLATESDNPMSFFQIWLNLPRARKRVPPEFKMLWNEQLPVVVNTDSAGLKTLVRVIAGDLEGRVAIPPPVNSWASDATNAVAIWWIEMDALAEWTLPPAIGGLHRDLYLVSGEAVSLAGRTHSTGQRLSLKSDVAATIGGGNQGCTLLVLQGRPIGEPIAQHGPFVMNTAGEIRETIQDYHRTQFGGWPWPSDEPTLGDQAKRFARRGDALEEPS